ncbi:MAG: aspartate-semialdehyde dehydrogenase [Atopobiaceae bacterium]|nr:aspartate-semialdehyde dehydrogenase [Atopobiaceae bacterium]
MSFNPNGKVVAILGATGVVGAQMLQCLAERNFPIKRLVLLASARSAGKTIAFSGEKITVQEAVPEAFEGVDIVLGAAGDLQAKELLPEAVKRGCVCVDNSHAFRLDENVPLVIPEINAEDIKKHKGIISNPNCATIIGLVPLYPLHKVAGVKRIIVSTYQAASGAGLPGLTSLQQQMADVVANKKVEDPSPFAYQLAVNLIPQIGGFNEVGYTSEEMKMQNEGRKIMHLPELRVNCTCVRVPVMRSHSESITVELEKSLSPDEARAILSNAPGIKVVDNLENLQYPMPLDTSDQDLIYVGRIREDISADKNTHALTFFCCGDQIRKGAATNAVQIAERLL